MATEQNKPAAPAPASPSLPNTFKPSAAPATAPAPQTQPQTAAAEAPVTRVEIVAPTGAASSPETAAPDGTNPSQYPLDGTKLEGLMGGSGGIPVGGDSPSAAVLDGNPPAYDAENKHGLVEEPTFPKRVVAHCRIADMTEGTTVYKLGVSHPPYVVEAAGKGFAMLRAGTGGTVQITNDSEASFYTTDQSRQYGVADGNPNTSGDVKAP